MKGLRRSFSHVQIHHSGVSEQDLITEGIETQSSYSDTGLWRDRNTDLISEGIEMPELPSHRRLQENLIGLMA